MDKNLVGTSDPRQYGKGLFFNKSGQLQYRTEDYRLICMIDDNKLVVLALTVGHWKEVFNE